MDKARYPVEAHVLEGRSVGELAAAHGVHRSWIYKLLARYREGGLEALQPRSRRPLASPARITGELEQAILRLREQLEHAGHDAGAHTIAAHLSRELELVPSVSTIWRVLKRHGLITPQPQKRPLSSLTRFEADFPNEMWQADVTHWRLAGERHVEILNLIDDHSRLFLGSDAYPSVKAADVAWGSVRELAICTSTSTQRDCQWVPVIVARAAQRVRATRRRARRWRKR